MSKTKQNKINKRDQRVAAEILTRFMFCRNIDEVWREWDNVFEKYDLRKDPFTHTPCSPEDYYESRLEYDRQTMIERYGHCDGLD
jgi:hypothetical protein